MLEDGFLPSFLASECVTSALLIFSFFFFVTSAALIANEEEIAELKAESALASSNADREQVSL